MIKSFKHKGLKQFYLTGSLKGIQAKHAERLGDILFYLDQAECVEEMDQPGFRLHALSGELKGIWSVRVSGNWRVTFRFSGRNAEIVDYLDYH